MSRVRLLFLLLVALAAGFAPAAVVHAEICTYDASAAALDERNATTAVSDASFGLSSTSIDSSSGSILVRSSVAADAPMTLVTPVVATEAADDFANWGGEFVDDAIRAPATRPDFGNISAKIERQMQTRGWTTDLIDEAVTSGNKFPAVNKLGGANTPATRYVSPTTGQSVVIGNATGGIIQVGGPGFKYGP